MRRRVVYEALINNRISRQVWSARQTRAHIGESREYDADQWFAHIVRKAIEQSREYNEHSRPKALRYLDMACSANRNS
jgi:hypothetical protein